ncbi:hypothetical protein H206_01364 [Candidatus Electrothrix aarhusensis]|jgi:hypothetical protein|uniref:Protochlamydia outer membrane protein domain-containing protein n=1 Tax=Candidatus Electrothrix aarhusensis TaxID=1859131 RepID=A0A3S3QI84_9BACT|nr:hypothetical protein H206_01364 [Candidatus Electrothrix aarhusensis]
MKQHFDMKYTFCKKITLPALLLFLLASPVVAPGYTATDQSSTEQQGDLIKKSRWENRLHFSITGRQLDFEKLNETLTSSPLDRFVTSSDQLWTIDWQQDMFYGSLVYDFIDAPLFTLSSGLHFGVSQGEFSATNTVTGFNEWWRTEPAFLWGVHSAAEIFSKKKQGLFMRLRYNYFSARGDEEEEIVRNALPRNNVDARTATFQWKNLETEALVGWRFSSLTPLTGLNYSRFKLQKKMSHHITKTGETPFESLLIAALNAEDARYEYKNTEELAWIIGLEWQPTEYFRCVATSGINSHLGWQLEAQFSF